MAEKVSGKHSGTQASFSFQIITTCSILNPFENMLPHALSANIIHDGDMEISHSSKLSLSSPSSFQVLKTHNFPFKH